jgi:microsomal epoxide hydrolase
MQTQLREPVNSALAPEAFRIAVPDRVLNDLDDRLARTRWIEELGDDGWAFGLSVPYLRELVKYWRNSFDWRLQEQRMNRLAQFSVEIDRRRVHFIHVRGLGSNPFPLILTHGFPDSFLRFAKLIPLLTDPQSYGGNSADAFDVVVPSLPGYGFSERREKNGTIFHVSDVWQRLMTEHLGYTQYGAHGGDWGSLVTELLGRDHAKSVVGIHLTDVPFYHAFQPPRDPSAKEERYLETVKKFGQREGAYALIQGAEPQALSLGLNDSPAGLAAWIIEKWRRWSDCHGEVESRFTKDELISNVMLYWVTETITSSFGPYADVARAGAGTWIREKLKSLTGSSETPAAFAMFPKDLSHPPREWAERFFNVQRWTEMSRGGHFAALEEPELLAEDIRTFFRPLR